MRFSLDRHYRWEYVRVPKSTQNRAPTREPQPENRGELKVEVTSRPLLYGSHPSESGWSCSGDFPLGPVRPVSQRQVSPRGDSSQRNLTESPLLAGPVFPREFRSQISVIFVVLRSPMEGLFKIVAASLARHGIDCPEGVSTAVLKRVTAPVAVPTPSPEPSALPEHSFRRKSESDPAP